MCWVTRGRKGIFLWESFHSSVATSIAGVPGQNGYCHCGLISQDSILAIPESIYPVTLNLIRAFQCTCCHKVPLRSIFGRELIVNVAMGKML